MIVRIRRQGTNYQLERKEMDKNYEKLITRNNFGNMCTFELDEKPQHKENIKHSI